MPHRLVASYRRGQSPRINVAGTFFGCVYQEAGFFKEAAGLSVELMRVAFVSRHDAHEVGAWSGTIYHMWQALLRQSVEVQLISPLSTNKLRLFFFHKAAARLFGKQVDAERFPLVLQDYARQIERQLRDSNADVVFCPSSVAITKLVCRQPIIFYTDAFFHAMSSYYPDFRNLTASALVRGRLQEEQSLQNARFAVYASDWAADAARAYTDSSKVRMIPFGANLPIYHNAEDVDTYIEARRLTLASCIKLLFVGVDWHRKGGDVALACAKRLNELGFKTELWVVGCLPPSPIPSFVKRFGFISKHSEHGVDILEKLFREAHFFILPTHAEAAGIVFCEASAFGLPILTLDTGGVSTYVPEGVSGYRLPPGSNGHAFAARVRGFVTDLEEYVRLSRGSYRQYKERLNWNTSVRAFLDLFREAVAEPAITTAGATAPQDSRSATSTL